MPQETGKFSISFVDLDLESRVIQKEGIYLGRLDTCEVVLEHHSVSRIHAGINFVDSRYILINLSAANLLTINGRLLKPQTSDVLADGDTIQIGPFTISVGQSGSEIVLVVETQFVESASIKSLKPLEKPPAVSSEADGVLKVFWEKRSREKDDWGSRLRPTEEPIPGKSMFNWRPTRDLKRRWRAGLFIWSLLLFGALGAFAYFRYPNAYAPKPLSLAHSENLEPSQIAASANANSCTTCHTPNEPLENSCVRCHSAEQFMPSNTKAHEQAGITCTSCHKEHQGVNFNVKASAIEGCAECHNDQNTKSYNGKRVGTPHNGSYGYPVANGSWKWKGVYNEVADAIPELRYSATGDKDEQAKLSRYFHTIHVARLNAPKELGGDDRGLVSCSTCHKSFEPIDIETPKQTCAVCHTTPQNTDDRDRRFSSNSSANCISCHVQHPYSGGRWNEFMTSESLKRRTNAVAKKLLPREQQ